MADAFSPRLAARIGLVDVRRRLRQLSGNPLQATLLIGLGALPSATLLWLGFALREAARSLTAPVAVPRPLVGSVGFLWVFAAFMFAQRVVVRRRRPPAAALVLTTVSHRTAAAGVLVGECLGAVVATALPTAAVTVLVWAWFGVTPALVLAPIAVWMFLIGAVTTGAALGYGALALVDGSTVVAGSRTEIGGLVSILGYGAFVLAGDVGGVTDAFALVPHATLLGFALLGTPVTTPATVWVTGVATSLLVVVVAAGATEVATRGLWYDETPADDEPDDTADDERSTASTVDALAALSPVRRPVARVAASTVRRTVRAPLAAFPLLVVAGLLAASVWSTAPTVPALLAVAVGWPWLAGGLFTLNAVGEAGSVRTTVALASTSSRAYAVGRCLPGVVSGFGVVALCGAAAAVAVGSLRPVGTAAVGCLAAGATPFLAAGVGTALPQHRDGPTADGDPAPPTATAVLVYSTVALVATGAAVGAVRSPRATREATATAVGSVPALVGRLPLVGAAPEVVVALTDSVTRAVSATPASTVRLAGPALALAVLYAGALAGGLLFARTIARRPP